MSRDFMDSHNEEPPTDGAREQCTCRLVDMNGVFQGDEQVAQNEDGENNEFHGVCEQMG